MSCTACRVAGGVTPYVPKPLRGSAVKNGFFTKEQFHYDADTDVLICPGGQKLEPKYKSKVRDNEAVIFVNTKACKACDRIYRRLLEEGNWPWVDSHKSQTHDRVQEHTPDL
jgi:hypothetical protein